MYGHKPAIGVIVLVILAVILPYIHYRNNVYPLDLAHGYLSRASAAGNAGEMIEYCQEALDLLSPYTGNPKWWFPTPHTDFDYIKRDLTTCIERLRVLNDLSPESDAYQQGLDDVRGKLRVLADNVNDASLWVFISLPNVIYCILWLIALIVVIFIWWR